MNDIHVVRTVLIISKSRARESGSWWQGHAGGNTPEGPDMGQGTRNANRNLANVSLPSAFRDWTRYAW